MTRGQRDEPIALIVAQGRQAVVDQLGEYQRLGLSHVLLDFRRDDLTQMIDILDLVTGTIRPALATA